ncbi:MAG: hypothetical protein KBD06_02170 [Candidatus Pacebacteria bacterium]|nr:hypothetical protein [Candidatus Paceibacterota bacterium]
MRNSMRFLFAGALAVLWFSPAIAALPASCTKEDDTEKAIAACSSIIDSQKTGKEDLAAALSRRAVLRISWGEKEEAQNDLNRALELKPNDASLYGARAATYDQYDNDKAVADMDKAIELAPKNAEYRVLRAKLHVLSSTYYSAEEDFSAAVKLEPKNVERYSARYEYYSSRHEYDKALADATQIVSLGKPEWALHRGQTMMYLGRFDEAFAELAKYTDIIEKEKDNGIGIALGYGMRAYCRMTMGQFDKAVAEYSKAITAFDNPTLRQLRGNAFVQMKQYELAIQDYSAVLMKKPEEVATLYLRAVAYDLNGQPKLALGDRTDAAFYSAGLKQPKKQ